MSEQSLEGKLILLQILQQKMLKNYQEQQKILLNQIILLQNSFLF